MAAIDTASLISDPWTRASFLSKLIVGTWPELIAWCILVEGLFRLISYSPRLGQLLDILPKISLRSCFVRQRRKAFVQSVKMYSAHFNIWSDLREREEKTILSFLFVIFVDAQSCTRNKEGEKERGRQRRRKKERGNPIWSLKNEGECNLGEKCCRGSSNDFQRLFQFIERCKQRLCWEWMKWMKAFDFFSFSRAPSRD